MTTTTTPKTLYRATSKPTAWPHRGHLWDGVVVQWIVMTPRWSDDQYREMLTNGDPTDAYSRSVLDDYVTADELTLLTGYLSHAHGLDVEAEPISLPFDLEGGRYAGLNAMSFGGPVDLYLLFKEDDYFVGTEIAGYYRVDHEDVVHSPACECKAVKTVEIHYRPNNTYIRFGCALCGGSTDKQDFLAEFADLDGDRHTACDQCATAGPDLIRARMLKRAADLESGAAELRRQATARFVLATPRPTVYCAFCKTMDESKLRLVPWDGRDSYVCGDCANEDEFRGAALAYDCDGGCDGGHWGNDNLWHGVDRGATA